MSSVSVTSLMKLNEKVYCTYSTPRAAYAASPALCVTGVVGIQPISQPKPAFTDHIIQPLMRDLQHSVLIVYSLHPSNPCKYNEYYAFADRGGMEG